jgi:glutamate-1-semialdehyde aminotransferase
MLRHLLESGDGIYESLADRGAKLREGLRRVAREEGVAVFLHGTPNGRRRESSLVMLHLAAGELPAPTCPEELIERGHPLVGERLLKSVLLLEDLSTRSGIGAISTAHKAGDIELTLKAYRAAFRHLKKSEMI